MALRHWNTKDILNFALWLWEEKQTAYSLLAIHGTCWGLKIGTQLALKWEDIIDEKGNTKKYLDLKGEDSNREISPFCAQLNFLIYKELKPKKEELIYVNHKTKKIIETSNLSKNLQRFAEAYMNENNINSLDYYPIKGASFQIAWARDILEINNYSKKSFLDLVEFMGKKSLKDLIDFVGLNPIEEAETTIRFDIADLKKIKIVNQPIITHKNSQSRPDFMFVFEE